MFSIFLRFFFFFFNDTATTEIYTLSLHDALPISRHRVSGCLHLSVPQNASPSRSSRLAVAFGVQRCNSRLRRRVTALQRTCRSALFEQASQSFRSRKRQSSRRLLEQSFRSNM